jgi:hypothetical protein
VALAALASPWLPYAGAYRQYMQTMGAATIGKATWTFEC